MLSKVRLNTKESQGWIIFRNMEVFTYNPINLNAISVHIHVRVFLYYFVANTSSAVVRVAGLFVLFVLFFLKTLLAIGKLDLIIGTLDL